MSTINISEARQALAPSGTLISTINYGNPILARHDAQTGEVSGVSVDIARQLADWLEVPLELRALESAGKAVAAVESGDAEIGFFARDPDRARLIAFTAPYILIEGCYLVRNESPLEAMEQVDVSGNCLTVGKGSAYDLFLTREIKHATIERAPTSPAVVQTFLETRADVAAGVRQQLEKDTATVGGLRLLPGHFMVIEQAMGVARRNGPLAEQVLSDFVEKLKAEGFVEHALKRHGVAEVSVAPPGGQ